MRSARLAVQSAVRTDLSDLPPDARVLVACSGGPDSMALLAAAVAVSAGREVAAAIVDHGLQPGSAAVAQAAAAASRDAGAQPVEVLTVRVGTSGGPEAAARQARYEALDSAAERLQVAAVLLGHTADDQAETVLLGLLRGAGARALAGMPARRGHYRRPLLELPRDFVRSAYPDLPTWDDPHNRDPRFARSRVRSRLLPLLEAELGPGVAMALARSAGQVGAEVAAVDVWADEVWQRLGPPPETPEVRLPVDDLQELPEAVLVRLWVQAAVAAGARRDRLTTPHLRALTRLVTHWRGQGPVDLPGGVDARRVSGTVVLRTRSTSAPEK